MDAIATVTLTLGRNRRPGSPVAPNVPLSDSEWQAFQAWATDTLKAHAGRDGSWVEVHHGVGEWDGVREESAKVTLLDARDFPVSEFMESVGRLALRFDQDAIAVQTGLSMLAALPAVAA